MNYKYTHIYRMQLLVFGFISYSTAATYSCIHKGDFLDCIYSQVLYEYGCVCVCMCVCVHVCVPKKQATEYYM